MNNSENMNPAIKKLADNLGCTEGEVAAAVSSGQINKLIEKMNPTQAGQLNRVLSDPEMSKKLMESPQAQALMKKLFGG